MGPVICKEEWKHKLKELLQAGNLNIKNINLSKLVLNWLALEYITSNLTYTHTSLFYDNTLVVGYAIKIKPGSSLAAGLILRFLGMRVHSTQVSHLTPISIAGEENDMTDIISSAFQKGNYFLLTITSLHILKITSPSHRGTPRPNPPFLPSGRNK